MKKRKIEIVSEGHPDDIAAANESIVKAHAVIDAFASEHREDLVSLILTYGDVDAEARLATLREKFWSELV